MSKKKFDINLTPLEELFTTQEMRDDEKREKVFDIPIVELVPFKNHPFKVNQDEELDKMIASIKDYGVILPAIARPLDDGYELVSGHRRKVACEILGIETMPVLVREMTDDQAIVLMVDSNLQREHILPSEKAFAYKMKLDAIKHQGKLTSRQVVGKLESADLISDNSESGRQVQRYIRLTNLIQPILDMVDNNKMALTPAVELSYLSETEQKSLLESMECEDCTPSLSQAQKLKKLSQEGHLNVDVIYAVLTEDKPNQKEQLKFLKDSIKKYFPKDYSTTQMEEVIVNLLADWQRKRDSKNRDDR